MYVNVTRNQWLPIHCRVLCQYRETSGVDTSPWVRLTLTTDQQNILFLYLYLKFVYIISSRDIYTQKINYVNFVYDCFQSCETRECMEAAAAILGRMNFSASPCSVSVVCESSVSVSRQKLVCTCVSLIFFRSCLIH